MIWACLRSIRSLFKKNLYDLYPIIILYYVIQTDDDIVINIDILFDKF